MDYLLKNKFVSGTDDALNTVTQQPIDLDFTLPDYCADIERILKCALVPKIYSRSLSAGQLRIDGASVITLLYCDSNNKALRCCEQTVPFSATIPVSEDAQENMVITTAKAEYLNCRALTPRRLTVHGAFSLYTCVLVKKIFDVKESCANPQLQIKTESREVAQLCEFIQEQFNVAQSVTLNPKSLVESIVRSEVTAVITDCQQKSDKLILKGEATLRMLYICDAATGEIDRFVYVFPFTQTIDAKSSDCTITDVRLDVLTYELLLSTGVLTEEPSVSIDIKMSASVLGYQKTQITYITDAFSIAENTNLSASALTLCSEVIPLKKSCTVKSSLNMGEKPVSKIIDIFCEEPSLVADIKDNSASFSGKLKLCILACLEDGELLCIERQVDIDLSYPVDCSSGSFKHLRVDVMSVSYRMTEDNSIDIRLDMQLTALITQCLSINQIESVTSAGESKNGENVCPLTLYYAQSGEKVWDIAKRYSASVSSLCHENGIDYDELPESRMLMILNA